jgi:hypothetical protein
MMTAPDRTPHLVLAVLPDAVQARLDALRRTHYPPDRNRVPAHCTLFHAIPGMVAAELIERIATLTAQTPPPHARLDRVIDLDRGTALGLFSPDLIDLRETLADHFHGLLTGGDAVPPRLHVTIQNKVDRPAARALQRTLGASWQPIDAMIPALAVHRVVDGTWLPVGTWRFRQSRR